MVQGGLLANGLVIIVAGCLKYSLVKRFLNRLRKKWQRGWR